MPGSDAFLILTAAEGPRRVYRVEWDGEHPPSRQRPLPDQENISLTREVFGLAKIPLGDGDSGIAVLTDRGMSVFRDEHFEYVSVPWADKTPAVYQADSRDNRTYLTTSDGVYAIELGQAAGDHAGPVSDLLTDSDLGVTYVARGNKLQVVRHAGAELAAQDFDDIDATHLARDRQGRLIADDGTRIVRYEKGQSTATQLFQMVPTVDGEWDAPRLTSLLAASDGVIWATYGSSLFRWNNGKLEEFSIFKDEKAFPARSEMLSRVLETYDHRIWVVASDESHLFYHGEKLEGGLLEWTGAGFKRIDMQERYNPYGRFHDNG